MIKQIVMVDWKHILTLKRGHGWPINWEQFPEHLRPCKMDEANKDEISYKSNNGYYPMTKRWASVGLDYLGFANKLGDEVKVVYKDEEDSEAEDEGGDPCDECLCHTEEMGYPVKCGDCGGGWDTWGKDFPCSICAETIIGYGNNAMPINDGRCCDDCNSTKVIPARILGVQ